LRGIVSKLTHSLGAGAATGSTSVFTYPLRCALSSLLNELFDRA